MYVYDPDGYAYIIIFIALASHYLRAMDHVELIIGAGLLAGAMNAVAGGGSFVTFPALVYAGVPPIVANASSTVALYPASLSGAWEYREYIRPFPNVPTYAMIGVTFFGGLLGAMLLLFTSPTSFSDIVPWLLLVGSAAFAFGRQLGNVLRKHIRIGSVLLLSSQFFLGIYGGYFGGAVGIMMMAVWSMWGLSDIRVTNANKNLFVGIANTVAVILFILAGKIAWMETGVMFSATVIGGFLGARYSKKLDPAKLRMGIVVFNFLITVLFFVKAYL